VSPDCLPASEAVKAQRSFSLAGSCSLSATLLRSQKDVNLWMPLSYLFRVEAFQALRMVSAILDCTLRESGSSRCAQVEWDDFQIDKYCLAL
jgi:hypothetical protein